MHVEEANQAGRELANGMCNHDQGEIVLQLAGRSPVEREHVGRTEGLFLVIKPKEGSSGEVDWDIFARAEVLVDD